MKSVLPPLPPQMGMILRLNRYVAAEVLAALERYLDQVACDFVPKTKPSDGDTSKP